MTCARPIGTRGGEGMRMPNWMKMIEAKTALAKRGAKPSKAGDNPRIPPGQKQVHDFPILDLGWNLKSRPRAGRSGLFGMVEAELDFDWKTFNELAANRTDHRFSLCNALVAARHGLERRAGAGGHHAGASAGERQIRDPAQRRRIHHQSAAGSAARRRCHPGPQRIRQAAAAGTWRARCGCSCRSAMPGKARNG